MSDCRWVGVFVATFILLTVDYQCWGLQANLRAEHQQPLLIAVSWLFDTNETVETTVQTRRSNDSQWVDAKLYQIDSFSNRSGLIRLSDACASYYIRLKLHTRKRVEFSETITLAPMVVDFDDEIQPVVLENRYNKRTEEVEIDVSVENGYIDLWPPESRQTNVEVHFISTVPTDDLLNPMPAEEWLNDTVVRFRFPPIYARALATGNADCMVLFYVERLQICGRNVPIQQLSSPDVSTALGCRTTLELPCQATTPKPVIPKCDPVRVDARRHTNETNRDVVQVNWQFGEQQQVPKQYILRYGYSDVSTESLISTLMRPMKEIGRLAVDGNQNSTNMIFDKTFLDPTSELTQRIFRISICAVYDTNNYIKWDIVETYPVRDSYRSLTACKCDTSSRPVTSDLSTGSPVLTVANVQPAPYDDFWLKVTPLLVVFILLTFINIGLLYLSYYYYTCATEKK